MDGIAEKPLLDQLDKLPKIRQFDAFPKTQASYTQRSAKGGIVTIFVALGLLILAWNEARDYLYGAKRYEFEVNNHIGKDMQINLDMTVAMQCHYLTVDVRDGVGDRLHLSDIDLQKDGTTFEIGRAGRLDSLPDRRKNTHVGKTISASKKKQKASWGRDARPEQQKQFKKTAHVVEDGPACRIYGSIGAKRVTGNLHVTTLGHGYFSWEHTDHKLMNLSHVIHELSFGPYFPHIAQPLDSSMETSNEHFAVFEYFVSVIPTRFLDKWGRKLETNQYSVNDYSRVVTHGQGVPGIFIKYDIEPLTMTIHERTTTLIYFLVRLAGILGGVWVCAGFGYRIGDRMIKLVGKIREEGDPSYEDYAKSYSTGYATSRPGANFAQRSTGISGGGWLGNVGTHRHTESVQQRIFSEEGRAPW
ncbi:hypothetical protein L7F22_009281 [Adiantum nelumboides]|nr:hypothetical protein [Adiantum nelumboides]